MEPMTQETKPRGRPSKGRTSTFIVRVEPETLLRFDLACELTKRSRSDVLRELIDEWASRYVKVTEPPKKEGKT